MVDQMNQQLKLMAFPSDRFSIENPLKRKRRRENENLSHKKIELK